MECPVNPEVAGSIPVEPAIISAGNSQEITELPAFGSSALIHSCLASFGQGWYKSRGVEPSRDGSREMTPETPVETTVETVSRPNFASDQSFSASSAPPTEIVRLVFELTDCDHTGSAIAHALNAKGFTRRNDRPWTPRQVRAVASRRVFYRDGVLRYGETQGQNPELALLHAGGCDVTISSPGRSPRNSGSSDGAGALTPPRASL